MNDKRRYIFSGIIVFVTIIFLSSKLGWLKADNDKKNNISLSDKSSEVNSTETQDIQSNTSAMVDYLIKKAKAEVNTVNENKLTEAIDFIKENIGNLFKDNMTMEKAIYYGSLLEYYYAIDNNSFKGFSDVKGEIGMDTVQAVKYVYRGAEKTTDKSTIENIKQIEQNLIKIN